jgi:uncharacterized membrane protein
MMNLKQLLNNPPKKISNKVIVFLLIVALLGFIDAGYLTVKHFQGVIPPCSVTSGCEEVLTSAYSVILGIPVSLTGMIFYLLVLVGVFGYWESKNHNMLKWSLLLTIPAFIASLWFVYIQVFSIGSYCIYCLGSFLTSTILFVTAMEIFASREQY